MPGGGFSARNGSDLLKKSQRFLALCVCLAIAFCTFSVTTLAAGRERAVLRSSSSGDSRPGDNETPFFDPMDANKDDRITVTDAPVFLRADQPKSAAEVLQRVAGL